MREAFRCDCGPSPRREPLSRMEVVAQLFFYARRFSVGAFQGRREFLRRPEILVVASFRPFPFFAVFLAHNRRNISARRSLRQALRIFSALPSFALALSPAFLSACHIFPFPPPPPFTAGTPLRVAAYSTSSFCPKHHWPYSTYLRFLWSQ